MVKTSTRLFSFVILFTLLGFTQSLVAQARTCAASDRHEQAMQDPDYAAEHARKKEAVRQYIQANGANSRQGDVVYIPVAVHFQETGLGMACAIDKALSQVEILNQDMGATNPDIDTWNNVQSANFPGIDNGATCFRFCLASLNHPAAAGIAEGDYAVTLNMPEGDTASDWVGYLNFFVRDLGGGLLGFSPLGGSLSGDGVTCTLNSFGNVSCDGSNVDGPFDLGRTITHEVGHYFSLPHPFDSGDCAADGDGIADTPFTNAQSTGCPADGTTTCTEPVLWPTYMEYCDDVCLFMWSQDQATAMDNHFAANVEGNIADATIRCEELACIGFSGSRTVTNESCDGNDGQISMSTFNGNPPFEYSINGGLNFFPTSVFQNMTQGTYDLVIRDATDCEWVGGATINRSPAQVNIVSLTPSFCGNPDGEIVVNVSGNSGFNYFINGVQSTNGGTFSDIAGGQTYNITVAGNNGCLGGIDVALPNEDDLEISVDDINPVSCFLFDNGSIAFSLGGGEAPFRYILDGISDSTSVPLFDGLAVGEYNVSVIDGRGCESDIPFQIFQGSGISEDCPCEVFAPTAMTVDQDDLNEYFEFYSSCPINKFELQIFGRNGQLVFETQDINDKWNGGASADYYVEPEVFFYRLRFSWGGDEDIENIQEKTGFITVLR